MLAYMAKNGIDYTYLDIDEKAISSNLHKRMKSQKISTRRYNLPVLDFSGELSVRPDKTKILAVSKGLLQLSQLFEGFRLLLID